ncbi:MAG: hypothetical protein ING69_16720, partial [Rhodocyclaceae bacterium]|nr:hypothetical protein [Rhodocyclaceae bacterium]
YAESIPFSETRDYVKKVILNKWYYGHRIHGKSASLSELMGVVPAKPGATIAGTDRPATTSSSAISNPSNPPNPQLAAVTR